jgi:hypothetical protein
MIDWCVTYCIVITFPRFDKHLKVFGCFIQAESLACGWIPFFCF